MADQFAALQKGMQRSKNGSLRTTIQVRGTANQWLEKLPVGFDRGKVLNDALFVGALVFRTLTGNPGLGTANKSGGFVLLPGLQHPMNEGGNLVSRSFIASPDVMRLAFSAIAQAGTTRTMILNKGLHVLTQIREGEVGPDLVVFDPADTTRRAAVELAYEDYLAQA